MRGGQWAGGPLEACGVEKAPGEVGALGDADARAGQDVPPGEGALGGFESQRAVGIEQGHAVVLGGDAQGMAELAGAREQGAGVGLLAAAVHVGKAFERLRGADQDGRGNPLRVGDDVEHEVIAVGEVDIRVPRRAEHGLVATRARAVRVAGGVIRGSVGFGFDDAATEVPANKVSAEHRRGGTQNVGGEQVKQGEHRTDRTQVSMGGGSPSARSGSDSEAIEIPSDTSRSTRATLRGDLS